MPLTPKQSKVIHYIVMNQIGSNSYWIQSPRAIQRIQAELGISRASLYRYIQIFKDKNILRSTDESRTFYIDVTKITADEKTDKD